MQVPSSTPRAEHRAAGVSLGGLLMVVGGLLVAVGTMFPWVDLLSDVGDLPVEANKTTILVAGVVTLCAGVLFMIQRPRFQLAALVAGGAALVAVILLIGITFDIQARFDKPIDLTAVLDWAWLFALIGAGLGVAGAVIGLREKPPRLVPADEVVGGPAPVRARRWVGKNYLVAPAIIYAIIITQIPFLITIWFSLQKWNLLRPENSRFNGAQNYIDLFRTDEFASALFNTVFLTFFAVTISLFVGLFFAELVNHRFPGRGIVRTLLITPFLVMPVVGALGWKNMMFNPVFGVVDWVITSLGGPRIDWFAEYPMAAVIIIVVWRWAPFMMLILLAGMQALSDEVREAGRVDGASGLQEFRFIVLPHLKPFMQLSLLFGIIYILAEFDSIAMTTQGGPGDQTMNLPYLIYRTVFFSYDIGRAAAMGVVLVVITFIFATLLIRLMGRLMEGSAAR
jgi:polyol transport system permease protein